MIIKREIFDLKCQILHLFLRKCMEISTINVTVNGVCVEAALFSLSTSEISFQASLTLAVPVNEFSDLNIRDTTMICS